MFHSLFERYKNFQHSAVFIDWSDTPSKKQCAARKQGNQQLQRPYDFLIEDLYSLLDDINSHLTEELQHEKNL